MNAAMALAAELASAYPGRGIGELNLAQYAKAIEGAVPERAVLAIGDLVQAFRDRPPTLGQLNEALRIRGAFDQPALSAHEEIGYRQPSTKRDIDHWAHGKLHLAELLSLPKDQRTEQLREIAQHPDRCGCDQRILSGVSLASVVTRRWEA